MDISVIIVNYNVREFLRGALESVRRSLAFGGLAGEIFVVDNASRDGSAEMVRASFPDVRLIALEENLGFGKANNIAMKQAQGDYLLILNPDTIVGEDTLRAMTDFMRVHPDAGVSGCKLLNADGSFQISCRRGFPTPWASFTKLFGLSSFFPNSPRFAQYNLTYLSTDETYEIDALAGAFMMISRAAYEKTSGFDEDYFMYGEDIDLCYRIKQAGFKVYYVHSTSTVHFKGESTRRSVINEVQVFYEAMHIFVRKHYGSSPLFTVLLRLGIMARSFIALLKKYRGAIILASGDFLLTMISVFVVTKYLLLSFFGLPKADYPWAIVVPAIVVLLVNSMIGAYSQGERRRARPVLMSMPAILIILSSMTYFFKEIPSSRTLVLLASALAGLVMIFYRFVLRLIDRIRYGGEGTARPVLRNTIIAGTGAEAERIAALLLSSGFMRRYRLAGFIDRDLTKIGANVLSGITVKGDLGMLPRIIRDEKITQVIFPAEAFSYSDMLRAMQSVSAEELTFEVSFNVVPQASDVLLSRSKIELIKPPESAESLALMPLEYNIQKMSHRIGKRLVDIIGSIFAYPFVLIGAVVFRREGLQKLRGELVRVLRGKRSLVGIRTTGNEHQLLAKSGLVSLCDVAAGPVGSYLRNEDIEQMNIYYARHHSLGMDFEILLRKLFSNKTV
ncbi:MAG TPA: glycosyltransferase [Candidatus Kapabacteria bacterium]|nr:glycosyltransferase [Candidatus Kapabacteria bacterium]